MDSNSDFKVEARLGSDPDVTIVSEAIGANATAAEVAGAIQAMLRDPTQAAFSLGGSAAEVVAVKDVLDGGEGHVRWTIAVTRGYGGWGPNFAGPFRIIDDTLLPADASGTASVVQHGALRHVARGLEEGKEYAVSVRARTRPMTGPAFNTTMQSPFSPIGTVRAAGPPLPPTMPQLLSISSTSAQLRWDRIDMEDAALIDAIRVVSLSSAADFDAAAASGSSVTGFKLFALPARVVPSDEDAAVAEVQTVSILAAEA